MSTGHRRYEEKTTSQLYALLGNTGVLKAQPVKLDCSHDVPDAGGISVDRKTVYIDRRFAAAIKSGAVRVRGMTPGQIIQAITEHEHTEKVVMDGDNPVDTYPPAHEYATAAEHDFVRKLGVDPARYEADILDALKSAERRDPENPPHDLWCGPYLDDPDANDKRVLAIFRRKGVGDAFKRSKKDVGYGVGANECRRCRHFEGNGDLAPCEIVSGLVRRDRQCEEYAEK
jgi:hypothetical protein